MNLADLRRDYALAALDRDGVDPDPIVQFTRWFNDAQRAGILEPNAMTLATCTADGIPSARVVLLKDVSPAGFTFFTDYRSQKGEELAANPRAALVFLWKDIERQVRIAGSVERVTREESEAYYRSRPVGSRVGAWASRQSSVLETRAALEAAVSAAQARFPGDDVPLPPHWGGYRVLPASLEFWQGRQSRLHDRLRYRATESGWTIERLSP